MDERRLDRLERTLFLHARLRRGCVAVPQDFTERVMRSVRQCAEARSSFWDIFGSAARRFAPVGAFAAAAVCGYAEMTERVLNQALLALSLHGGSSVLGLARMLP
jgi:hypothetical protein